MFSEFLADFRGIIGNVTNYVRDPFLLLGIILVVYVIYRRTST